MFFSPDDRYNRSSGILNQKELNDVRFHIAGCGGVGSAAAVTLAKIGASDFVLYDFDKVEIHNMSNQFFVDDFSIIGNSKVDELKKSIHLFGNHKASVITKDIKIKSKDDFDIDHQKQNILIVGIDSMEGRKECYEIFCQVPDFCLMIESRMASKFFKIYTIDKLSGQYADTLHSSEESEDIPCTEKSVMHTNLCLASMITENVRRFLMHQKFDNEIIFDMMNSIFMKRSFE